MKADFNVANWTLLATLVRAFAAGAPIDPVCETALGSGKWDWSMVGGEHIGPVRDSRFSARS